MHATYRSSLSILAVAALVSSPCFAFQSPLSDEAVREAYFLGQRHDESLARFFAQYSQHPPLPKRGPHISSITFLTPFAQLVKFSARYIGNYNAQQAQLDHRGQQEFVKIIVEIRLTNSYGALLSVPAGSPSGPSSVIRRPYDFWRDFQVKVFSDSKALSPSGFSGKPVSYCGRGRSGGPCALTGAILELEFPPDAFSSDSATVEVIPPEGSEVSVSFYLARLR